MIALTIQTVVDPTTEDAEKPDHKDFCSHGQAMLEDEIDDCRSACFKQRDNLPCK